MKQFILSIFILLFGVVNGQSSVKIDQDYWLGYGISFKPLKKTEISLEAQQRFELENFEVEKNLIEIGLERKLSKYSNLGILYRATWRHREEHSAHRYAGYYRFKISKSNFKFLNRLGFQFDATDYTGETKSYLRNKMGVKYDRFKKVKPYFTYDVSFRFDNRNYIDNNRFSIGAQVRLKKKVKLKLFIRFDNESNRKEAGQDIIYGTKIMVEI